MYVPLGVGLLLVFMGRLAYHRACGWLREQGRLRGEHPDHFGVFLATVGVAITIWFLLEHLLRWQTPLSWRLAVILTAFVLADGLLAGLRR